MKTSAEVKNISEALLVAHKKIKHAIKDAKNPHFKNDYASLESVIDASKEHLLESGIVVIQGLMDKVLVTRLQHKSGEYMESSVELILTKNDMQAMGSAITYARRYSLASMLNISQSDDDGEAASRVPVAQSTAQKNVAGIKEVMNSVPRRIDAPKLSSNGDYVIKFGKKLAGKKLSEVPAQELENYVFGYLEKGAIEKNKPLTGDALELFNEASAYLNPPGMDSSEQIR